MYTLIIFSTEELAWPGMEVEMKSEKAKVLKWPFFLSFPMVSLCHLTTVNSYIESSSYITHKVYSSCCTHCGTIKYLRNTTVGNVEMTATSGPWTHGPPFGKMHHFFPCWAEIVNERKGTEVMKGAEVDEQLMQVGCYGRGSSEVLGWVLC